VRMASAPATMITIAITIAKIGRSMKNRDSNALGPYRTLAA
jgi:hypothetical protein